MSKKVPKRIVVPALLVTGLLSQASALHAASVNLVFSTYTTSECSSGCTNFNDSPIAGSHSVSLDMSVLDSSVSTTAYNNATGYEERLTTIINGEYIPNTETVGELGFFEQLFTQYGDSSDMRSMFINSGYGRSVTPVEIAYTGDLPPAYQPAPISGVSIVENRYNFIGRLDQGASPLFTDLNGGTIPLFLTNFHDIEFSFGTVQVTTVCGEYDEVNDICTSSFSSAVESTHGYAYLESVSVSSVPVPAAVWLFSSGLIGLAGIARRRK